MNLVLNLSPQTEARLREYAARQGRSLADLAMEVLNEGLAPGESASLSSPDERVAALRTWLERHPPSNAEKLDDSRDSMYADPE